jgi:hypothetical protein
LNPLNKGVYVLVMAGSIKTGNESIGKRDAIGFWETDDVILQTGEEAEFIVNRSADKSLE